MHAWEAIQTTLDTIENHLDQELTSEQLAQTAHLSPFYYQRLFHRLVHKPVQEYIKLRRLAAAAQALENSEARILDIALAVGFASHESLTRAFKAAYGMTPEDYRKHPVWLDHFLKPNLLLNYVMVDENVPLISEGIILEVRRQTLTTAQTYGGLVGFAPYEQADFGRHTGEDQLVGLWQRLHRERPILPCDADAPELGVTFQGQAPAGMFSYFAGVQVAPGATLPADYQTWTLQPGEYLVCAFVAESFEQMVNNALHKAQNYMFNTWLKNHGLVTEPFALELYPHAMDDICAMEVWLLPVQA